MAQALTGAPPEPDPLGHSDSFDAFMRSLGEPKAGEEHAPEPVLPAMVAEEDGAWMGSSTLTGTVYPGADGDVSALERGMRAAERSPWAGGGIELAQAGASDAATVPRVAEQPDGTVPKDETAPVVLVDNQGRPVTSQGRIVERPAGLDPDMFVRQGLADKVEYDALASTDGGGAAQLVYLAGRLQQFQQGGLWDAQRVGGKFNPAYVDYATIAIGLYCAALGLDERETLKIENMYATFRSRYAPQTIMDDKYTHLPERNVVNTNIGYQLFIHGGITDSKR